MDEKVFYSEEEIKKIRKELEDEYKEKLDATQAKLQEENRKTIEQALAEWKKKKAPPTQEELQKELDQEYLKLDDKLPWEAEQRKFTITELHATDERKIYG